MIEIKSSSNEKFKYFKSLLTKKGRDEKGEYIVEGIKCTDEALASRKNVTAVIVNETMSGRYKALTCPVYVMPESLTDRLSDTRTPQGVYAIIKKERTDDALKTNGAYVYCDRVADPGNLGTIIRTADAAGFDGVLLSGGCVEATSPKVVRSCMGSFFRMDIRENISPEILDSFKGMGGKIYGGILRGDTTDYKQVSYKGGVIIVVGNESSGICEEVAEKCTPVKIPIYGGAESLNVAVAAGIIMYKAAEEREQFV